MKVVYVVLVACLLQHVSAIVIDKFENRRPDGSFSPQQILNFKGKNAPGSDQIIPTARLSTYSNLAEEDVVRGVRKVYIGFEAGAGTSSRAEAIVGSDCDPATCSEPRFSYIFSVPVNVLVQMRVQWDATTPPTGDCGTNNVFHDETFPDQEKICDPAYVTEHPLLDGVPSSFNMAGFLENHPDGAVDLTDGGKDSAFEFVVGKADLLADIVIRLYQAASATDNNPAISEVSFTPSTLDVFGSENIIINIPYSRAVPLGAQAPADIKSVTAIEMYLRFPITNPPDFSKFSVDLEMDLIGTTSLITAKKSYTVSGADNVANPGETVTFTTVIANPGDDLDADVTLVSLIDDLRAYDLQNIFTIRPDSITISRNSVPLSGSQVNNLVVRSNNDEIVLWGPDLDLPDDDQISISFEATVNNMPCCLTDCAFPESSLTNPPIAPGCLDQAQVSQTSVENGGQGAEAGRCYCSFNQAHVCTFLDESTIASETFNYAGNCLATDTEQTVMIVRDATYVPIFAPTDPQLTKEADRATASAGDTITWTITVTNEGGRTTDDLVVEDFVPANTNFNAAASSPNWDCSSTTCTYPVGVMAPNAVVTIVFAVDVDTSLGCGGGFIGEEATVIIPQDTCCPDQNLQNNVDSDPVELTGSPDLTISKTADVDPARPGQTVTWNIEVRNIGNNEAQTVEVVDTLPEYLIPNAAASISPNGWSCGLEGQGVDQRTVCRTTFASLSPSSTGPTLNLVTTVASDIPCDVDKLDNTVAVDNLCGDANGNDNTITGDIDIVGEPDLTITKTDDDAILRPGQTVTYTITYSNIGERRAEGVVLTDTLPASVDFVSGTGGTWTQDAVDSRQYHLTLAAPLAAPLAANSGIQTATITVRAKDSYNCGENSAVNSVSVVTSCPEANTPNEDSEITPIEALPVLTITKTGGGQVTIGEVVNFEITYSNTGARQATGVSLTETVPAGWEYVAGADAWSCTAGGACTLNVDNLPALTGTNTVGFALRRTGAVACDPLTFTNTATVTQTCVEEVSMTSLPVPFSASGEVDLSVSKSTSLPGDTATAGQNIVFTFTYDNIGSASCENAKLETKIPTHTTPGNNPGWECDQDGNCEFDLNQVAPNGGSTQSFAVTVNDPLDCDALETDCEIRIVCDCADADTTNNFVSDSINLDATPVFEIRKVALPPQEFSIGVPLTFEISVRNIGNRHVSHAILIDTIPGFTNYVGTEGWSNGAPGTVTLDIGALNAEVSRTPAFATYQATFELDPVQFAAGAPEETTNVVVVHDEDDCGAVDQDDDVTVPIRGVPDLTIRKTDGGVRARPGDTVSYKLTYSNIGDQTAAGVFITEHVPAFSFFNAEASTAGWDCQNKAPAGTECTFAHNPTNNGLLTAGGTGEIFFAVTLNEWIRCGVDMIVNEAVVGSLTDEDTLSNNKASDSTPVDGVPDLKIWVTDNRNELGREDRVSAGEQIFYEISWVNAGARDARDVVVKARLPEHTTFYQDGSTDGWSTEDGVYYTLSYDELLPDVAHDGTGSAVFAVTVDNFPAGVKGTPFWVEIDNSCGESNPLDNHDEEYTPFVSVIDVKVHEKGYCNIIEWQIEYANTGDQNAENVRLTETISAGLEVDPDDSTDGWDCTGLTAGSTCTFDVGTVVAGAGGFVKLVTHPTRDSGVVVFENCVDVDRYDGEGNVLEDPTDYNNHACAELGLEGCMDACDSCCPEPTECCPDSTEVMFNFGGILENIGECST